MRSSSALARTIALSALALTLASCSSSDGPSGPAGLTNSIVFVSNRSGVDEIYSMNADGSNVQLIPSLEGQKSYPVPSPDGRRVAFTIGDLQTTGTSSLYVVNVDGSGLHRLTTGPGVDYEPTWSTTGSQIAFVSTRDGNDEIYVMNADGSHQTNLTNSAGSDDSRPSWSPNGRAILFQSNRLGAATIYTMAPTGGVPQVVISGAEPAWSSAGSTFLYKLNGQIWMAAADGDPAQGTQITSEAGFYFGPRWSADGSKIVYADVIEDQNEEIWTIDRDGGGAVQLTSNDSGDNVYPSWTRH